MCDNFYHSLSVSIFWHRQYKEGKCKKHFYTNIGVSKAWGTRQSHQQNDSKQGRKRKWGIYKGAIKEFWSLGLFTTFTSSQSTSTHSWFDCVVYCVDPVILIVLLFVHTFSLYTYLLVSNFHLSWRTRRIKYKKR